MKLEKTAFSVYSKVLFLPTIYNRQCSLISESLYQATVWLNQQLIFLCQKLSKRRAYFVESIYIYTFNALIVLLGKMFFKYYYWRPVIGIFGVFISLLKLLFSFFLCGAGVLRIKSLRPYFPNYREGKLSRTSLIYEGNDPFLAELNIIFWILLFIIYEIII